MIEACLLCSSDCEIKDLGLVLKRGESIRVADAKARSSKDLETEIKKGNVRMSRSTMKHVPRPVPPFVVLNRSPGPGVAQQVTRAPEQQSSPPSNAPQDEASLQKFREDLLSEVRGTISEEMSKALSSLPSQDPAQLGALLEGILRRVMPASAPPVQHASVARAQPHAAEPLYIPKDLVDRSVKPKVDLQSESSGETGDLDDAAAALRRLKKTQK